MTRRAYMGLTSLLQRVKDSTLRRALREAIDRERPFVEITIEGQPDPLRLDTLRPEMFFHEPLKFVTRMYRNDGTVVEFEDHSPPTITLEN